MDRWVGVGEPANATAQIPRSKTRTATRTGVAWRGVAWRGVAWRVAAVNETRFLSLALVFDGAPLRVSRRRLPPVFPTTTTFFRCILVPRPFEPVRCIYTHYARDIYSRAADAAPRRAAPAMRGVYIYTYETHVQL